MSVKELFRAPDPKTQIIGGFIVGMTGSLQHEDVLPLLQKHGFETIDPNAWYPLQQVLDFFFDVYYAPNRMFNLIAVGMHGGQHSPLPPTITTLEEFLNNADAIIRSGYRNGDAGSIQTEQIAPRHFRLTQSCPYPSDLYYGVWSGISKRFLPQGTHVVIRRTEVDVVTTMFDIQWEDGAA